jgi:glycosyltransferase involved in cell wall biosynthesis
MVGPDKDGTLDQIKDMAKRMDLKVRFTGKLSKAEWIALSVEYNIFINTSHYDNMPISVIEAIALGLPVVSTNVGGISYLLQDKETALLVDDNDDQAMLNALHQLIENPDMRSAVVQDAFAVVQEFDWSKVKSKWDEVLI